VCGLYVLCLCVRCVIKCGLFFGLFVGFDVYLWDVC